MAYDVGEVLEQAATQIRRFMPVMMHALDKMCSHEHHSVHTCPSDVVTLHLMILTTGRRPRHEEPLECMLHNVS